MKDCTARLLVFSGRPDPTWKMDESTMSELQLIWSSLTPIKRKEQSYPKLGYQGCRVRCESDVEWFVYQDMVTITVRGKRETRSDKAMKFQERLITSAPLETIPQSLLQIIQNQIDSSNK